MTNEKDKQTENSQTSGNISNAKLSKEIECFFSTYSLPEIRRIFRNAIYELSSEDSQVHMGLDGGLQHHVGALDSIGDLLELIEAWHKAQKTE